MRLKMKLIPKVGDYFALDIGTTAVRVMQLTGGPGGWSLAHYGVAPIDMRVSTSDSPEDQRKLAEIIVKLISESRISASDVVLGVPSDKMFATVVDLPDMPANELANTIKYQADQYIPMSLDEVKVDWAVLGKSMKDTTQNEVLIASVSNKFTEARLDLVEGLGFSVVAIEPDSVALARSLQPNGAPDGRIIIEIGDFNTDIVVTYDNAPRLIRSIPVGIQAFIKTTSQNLNVQHDQAEQFMMKFGVQKDKLEGQIYRAMETTLDQFTSEIVKSAKFFQTRYPNVPLSSAILSNYAATVPGFGQYLSEKIGLKAELGNPWQQIRVGGADQTNLQPYSAQFAVAIGLAQRGNQ